MATTIVTKYGGDAPAASDIVRGELAVDTENGRLYTENSSGAVVEIGLKPEGNVDVTGTVTADAIEIATTASDTGVELTLNGNKSSNGGVGSIIFENNGDSVGMIRSNRASANDAADMLFYTQATGGANTERMRVLAAGGIDVTGSVTADGANIDGAVTTGDLTIDNDDTPTLNFKKAASADILGTINVTTDAGSGGKMVFQTKRNGDTALDRMTIDDDGDVGIGTSSPTSPLTVTKDAGGIATFTGISSGGVSSVLMKQSRGSIASPSNSATAGDGNYILGQVYNSGYATIGSIGIITGSALNNGEIQFNTASSGTVAERMRILADGSVCQSNTVSLVASNYNNQAGAAWHEPDGHYEIATTSNVAPLEIGKNNATDGSLVVFRKQSTVVGSIGTASSRVYIGTGDTGLRFTDDEITPFNPSVSADRNGTVDLGGSSTRFQDLHLSRYVIAHQGAFLGGNASANHLDEYEEGTWTPILNSSGTAPTVTYTLQKGRYTKVGDLVTILVDCRWSANSGGTGNTTITGLPFANGDAYAGATVFEHSSAWSYASGRTNLSAEVNQSASIVTFLQNGSGLSGVGYDITTLGAAGYVIFSVTFKTA